MNNKKKIIHHEKIKPNKKDQKFYRKRILNLTKELLYQEENIDESTNQIISDSSLVITPSQDVYYTFNQYIKTCIEYFKNL